MNLYNAEGYIDLTAYEALRKKLPLIDRWYTFVLPIPTAASMTISKMPDDTAALQ